MAGVGYGWWYAAKPPEIGHFPLLMQITDMPDRRHHLPSEQNRLPDRELDGYPVP
jgi:hypothetical protein